MPKAFTEPEKQWIRQRLLEQGYRQFAAHGLKKTSVDELAGAAGISKGAFYLFYPSKEVLFMEVVEEAEKRFRQDVLAAIDLPGPSPRVRLFAVLKKAFSLWKTIPFLQVFTRSDYELLARKVPAEIIQEHLRNDQAFIEDLVDCCLQAGIPMRANPEAINGLAHALFFFSLHEDDLGQQGFNNTSDILLELVAAYCLGEVEISL
jgi:AcrR family transcriptional regulator